MLSISHCARLQCAIRRIRQVCYLLESLFLADFVPSLIPGVGLPGHSSDMIYSGTGQQGTLEVVDSVRWWGSDSFLGANENGCIAQPFFLLRLSLEEEADYASAGA